MPGWSGARSAEDEGVAESFPADGAVYGRPSRRRSRGRRALVALLVLVVVLGGLTVAADRLAANFARDRIAAEVREQVARQGLHSAPPQVTVGGFPFLTQVAAGRYESIEIALRDVRGEVARNTVRLPRLDIEARDVHAPLETLRSGQGDVTARTVEGRATIAYDTLEELIEQPGVELREQDGQLAMSAPVDVLGRRLTVRGIADITVEPSQVRLRFTDVTADDLPALPTARTLINAYAQRFSVRVPLPDLPFQLELREARATPDGLVVTGTAEDVPLNAVA